MEKNDQYDFIIIGAGISGSSLAYELSLANKSVLVLEMEDVAGYHSTGRSAAFFSEIYGNEVVRCITRFSRGFFESPPKEFCEYPLFSPRGVMFIANKKQLSRLKSTYEEVKNLSTHVTYENSDFAVKKVNRIKKENVEACVWDPNSHEVDVAALHQGYQKLSKKQGVRVKLDSEVKSLSYEKNRWIVTTKKQTYFADVIVNASGAWGDMVAELADVETIGLTPKKRTICIASVQDDISIDGWPLVVDIDEKFYFKPEGGNLLLSPADEKSVEPMDAYTDPIDVAIAVARVSSCLDFEITHVSHQWAGLRTFVEDKSPVIGFDNRQSKFFWLVGQGGYGIQMAPGIAKLATALLLNSTIPEDLMEIGFVPDSVLPNRLR